MGNWEFNRRVIMKLSATIAIGPVPPMEIAADENSSNYHEVAQRECEEYIRQIRQVLGAEPEGARLVVRTLEFGNQLGDAQYYEVVCLFDPTDEVSNEYAMDSEDCCRYWNFESILNLGKVDSVFDPNHYISSAGIKMPMGSNFTKWYGYSHTDKTFIRVIGNLSHEVYSFHYEGWKFDKFKTAQITSKNLDKYFTSISQWHN